MAVRADDRGGRGALAVGAAQGEVRRDFAAWRAVKELPAFVYLLVAMDRATRWVFVQIKNDKTAANALAFLKALHKACPIRNGMVERFNGRIADVLKTHRFNSQEDLAQTLPRHVHLYNHEHEDDAACRLPWRPMPMCRGGRLCPPAGHRAGS
jgi:transposase InsO family protein